jgi:hypothetical protein
LATANSDRSRIAWRHTDYTVIEATRPVHYSAGLAAILRTILRKQSTNAITDGCHTPDRKVGLHSGWRGIMDAELFNLVP